MAKTKKQYQSPFGERRTFSSPQGLRKHIDANYAKEAKETGLYNNKRWMDALIVGKPAGQATTSTNATGQQTGTRQRRTAGHRKGRSATGQQARTGGSNRGRQNRVNYREMTSQQIITATQELREEIKRRQEEYNTLFQAIGQQSGQENNRTMAAGGSVGV